MGAPLLNASAATSAFYESISLLGFLKKTRNDYDSLKGVKVKISYAEGKTPTIKSFGRSPRDQMFLLGNDEKISVLEYLQTKNVDENFLYLIALSDFGCANMGTLTSPEWYPLEALTIVEHQIVRKLSPVAPEKMLEEASKLPHDNLRNIVTRGLAVLGVSAQDSDNSILHAAGIAISNKPVKVPYHEATFSYVDYSPGLPQDLRFVDKNTDRWNTFNRKFYNTTNAFKGKIVILLPKALLASTLPTVHGWRGALRKP